MEVNTKLNQSKHSNESKQPIFNKLKQTRTQLKELKKFEGVKSLLLKILRAKLE